MYLLATAVAYAMTAVGDARAAERRSLELQVLAREAELKALKRQLAELQGADVRARAPEVLKAVAERYQFLFSWNPMAVLIQSYRAVLFQGTKPEIGPLLYALAVSAALCGIGFDLYHRQMPTVVDLI